MGKAITINQNSVISGLADGLTVPGLPASCRLALVHTVEQLQSLAQQWHALEAINQGAPHVFQSFDWCVSWCETYAKFADTGNQPQLIAGYDGARLVFVFPLMAARRMGLNILVWLTEPYGQYGDVLCAKGENAKLWIKAAINLIRRFKDVDLIHLRHVREDGILANHGLQELISARVPDRAPYLDLTGFKTEAEYDARYTSQQRKRRKKIRKSLEDLGNVAFASLPVGTRADTAMQLAISEKAQWLSERGRLNRVMSCPLQMQFLKRLSRSSEKLAVVVTELSAGQKPVSWEIGFRYGGTHFAYVTSHMNELTDLSPGRLHMDMSQRACIADGMERFDLMVPNDAHKESWCSGKVDTNDYFLPVSAKGSAYGHLYLRLLRPVARDIYHWLEPTVLPWLYRKAGRASST